jgi:hypothetical protein
LVGELPQEFDLEVAPGLADTDAIILAEALKQLNALFEHAVPAVAMRVLELLILTGLPFLKQGNGWVLPQEIRR